MKNSEGINNKIFIVILIIVLLLGTIMAINLFNKNENEESNITNNISNTTDNNQNENILVENSVVIESETIPDLEDEEENLVIVTSEYSTSKHNSGKGFIKVVTSGYIGDYYEPTEKENNDTNINEPVVEETADKTAPNVTVIYSKENITNENVVVNLKFNEKVSEINNGYILSEDGMSATKEYKENTSEEVKVYDLAKNASVAKVEIKNIDKEKPQTAKVSDIVFASKKIQTKITIEDHESGINLNGCKYKIDTEKEMKDKSNYIAITDLNSLVEKTVEEDGIYYLHVISMDNAGNTKEDTIELIVDTVMPTLNIKYSNTAITNKDVVVTITSNKEMQDIDGWKSNKDNTIFTKTYTENVDEEVEFIDTVGRKIKAKIKITNIDKKEPTEPKLSQNIFNTKPVDNSKNIDITLVATLSDNENGSGLDLSKCKYILNQNQETPTNFNSANTFTKLEQTLYFTIRENSTYYLHIQLVDYAGNEKVTTQTIISDTLNPVLTREYSLKDNTNENVVVTIKSNEVLKGTEGWEVFDNGKTLRKEFNQNIGRTIYTFYDLAGNPVSVDVTISNIDQVAPNDSEINKDLLNSLEFDIVTKISDEGFGLDLNECKYILDTNEIANFDEATTFKNENETLNFKVETDGIYYLHTLLKDKVGNEKVTTHEITVDATKAELEVKYSNVQITNENVTVTIKSNEEIQAVSGWTLSSDKKQLTKTFTANTNSTVEIKDIAGNITECKVIIENIDKVNPKVEVIYSTTSQTIEPVEVKIKANEKIQSIEGWTLSEDGTTLTKVFDENDSQTVTIRDIAGNTITTSIVVANIM